MPVDFGKTAEDYSQHRAGFPDELFERLPSYGVGIKGQKLLDLGCGTGTLAHGFARRGCEVTAIDRSAEMIAQAKCLGEQYGVAIEYRVTTAEEPGFDDDSFDVITAGQCWHWFDRSRAAEQTFRMLVNGGSLAICHFDWLPLPGNVVEATERLIMAHNTGWKMHGSPGIYPLWPRDIQIAGFARIETFSFDVDVPYTHAAWRGRVRASSGIAASLNEKQVAVFDTEHAAMLAERFPGNPLAVPHRVFAAIGRKE
ncbi:MAG: class I SAM-dependent methyltransferase [Candidatus Zixiibacteriota bacterium]